MLKDANSKDSSLEQNERLAIERDIGIAPSNSSKRSSYDDLEDLQPLVRSLILLALGIVPSDLVVESLR